MSEPVSPQFDWAEVDRRAVDNIRVLAMDAVEAVGNGHPGTAMSLAPAAYLLFQRLLRHNPSDPQWVARDRFVLSNGHSSLTLYIQLFLAGYGLELNDLESYRVWGSATPGHPEYAHSPGVETTTGPLGQGIGIAVGMAMAARRERGLLDPDPAPGQSLFDHHIYAFASDGDMEEGVSGEASSLAGTQRLGNLIVLYDNNRISIEDDTSVAFNEDVSTRYRAYGWDVHDVDWTSSGRYEERVDELYDAFVAAKAVTNRPSFINLRTIIAWPAPNAQNTGKAHGSALGADEVAATKKILGFDPEQAFELSEGVLEHTRRAIKRGEQMQQEWERRLDAWTQNAPERRELLDRLDRHQLTPGWEAALPSFDADEKGMATRKASGEVLTALAPKLPELWGGSADLAGSNNTSPADEPSFLPPDRASKEFPGDWYGRILHFGVREHSMAAVMNGIALHGGTRPYGGTFLVFSDYMRPAVRLAALMRLPVTYVWTHDSIGLGEDGPTHQPIEHLAALRAIPGLDVVRPADANETAAAWRTILEHTDRPAGLALTRQNVPVFPRGTDGFTSAEQTSRGAYVLLDAPGGQSDVLLIATGSEVQHAVEARSKLAEQDIAARVVSMPCREWFDEQDDSYRETVIPPNVRARVSVEAGVGQCWRDVVGDAGEMVCIEHYGASADQAVLFEKFGFTADAVVAAAQSSLSAARKAPTAPVRRGPHGPVGPAGAG